MPTGSEGSDDFFNSLSAREGSQRGNGSETPPDMNSLGRPADHADNQASAAKAKRIACIICRKRKLRCDGNKPSCGTCSRLSHRCAYDEVRRKSGPKRGYVKELEARLAQVETQLRSKHAGMPQHPALTVRQSAMRLGNRDIGGDVADHDMMTGFANVTVDPTMSTSQAIPNVTVTSDAGGPAVKEFPWEMMSLGLEEPLPPPDMVDEMHSIYFEKLAASYTMIHKYRYLAAMNLAPHMRPAICLRYAIWALACSITDKYSSYADMFYQRARKYAESDEMKGHGEQFVTIGHAQCWILITTYEFKMLYFPRAWMSAGRGARLAMMLGLHRQDGTGLEVKQVLPPPRDWTDREERRRTFWASYCNDRYASIGTGWPMTIDECDILTNLPASVEAFEKSSEEDTSSLADALKADGASTLSSFAGVVLMACLFGKNLTHLHRSTDSDDPDDPSGEFWKRHHKLDSIIMVTSMYLPDHLRLPQGSKDPNVVFLNMTIHSATICLHQAAILKAEKHNLSKKIIRDSTDRCFLAAGEIVSLMRLVSQVDLAVMNPFIAFCLYVAARIYTHAYKKRRDDESIKSNLDFLLMSMQAHRRKNPITESFLVQIMVELDAAGLEHAVHRKDPSITKQSDSILREGDPCPPVFQMQSETQPSFHELHQRESVSPVVSNHSYAPSHSVHSVHSAGSRAHSPQPHYQSSFTAQAHNNTPSLRPQQQRSLSNPSVATLPSQGWTDQTFISSRSSFSPQPRVVDASSMETEIEHNPPAQSQFYNPPIQFTGYSAAQDFSQAPAPETSFSMAPDWDMQNAMADSEWHQVLEGMSWEEANVIQSNMGTWRPLQSTVGQGH